MTNEDLSWLLLRRYDAAQRPFGRLLLTLHLELQRARAEWLAVDLDVASRRPRRELARRPL